ncbi:hypothetical protein EMIT0P201_11384 [Pseudomonas chlororaphis]
MKAQRPLKIKKFPLPEKEIKIAADSVSGPGIRAAGPQLMHAICEVSNGHSTTGTTCTNPLRHYPS